MPAVSVPKSLPKLLLEVFLISAGVFLGLMGDQWRDHAQQRELAEGTLRRVRAEIVENRQAITAVKDYHVTIKGRLDKYFAADANARKTIQVQLRGLQPVFFERTAWDLALATQALVYIDQSLAFNLSRVYRLQQEYSALTGHMMQTIYVRPPTESVEPFLGAVNSYYGDIVLWEPILLKMYDEILPTIDRALSESTPIATP